MIISKQKGLKEILGFLKGAKKIFLVGCAQCATVCKTGGEDEVNQMEKALKKEGKVITGKAILDPPCHTVKAKQFYQKNKDALSESDGILAMVCGDGAQSIMEGTRGKKVYPALDALFLGMVQRGGHFIQKCVLCGECVIDATAGICPLTVCSKGLLNGPCGGSKNEKCEVDRERDCGWIMIYKRLKELGELDKMKIIRGAKDNSKALHPQKIEG
ncbi:MAG: methylenetetrahydrofolate reductase C-terminal domain-containing protein [Candidatus Omnitrophica bacterium]|nr:methylenetetrahydrofolate reductase C-terminal domain-containing protein [Candidatus Omnitrophota bacterium]